MVLDITLVQPGVYRHFKGNIYHVLGVSENTETKELTVVYVSQDGPHAGKFWNRKIEMFLDTVTNHPDRPGYSGPRFELIETRSFI